MADRYWVGGTATWDGTAGTKWSTTSGGAGGASVPTSSDDVYFDQNSNVGTGAFTVTISSSRVCRNITVQNLDGNMTLAGSGSLSVYGNLTFPSTRLTVSNTGTFTIRGQSSVVNTGGVLIRTVSLGSRTLPAGAEVTESVTLAGSLNVSTTLYIACNLDTQGFTVQVLTLLVSNYVYTVNFRSSNIYTNNFRASSISLGISGVTFQSNLSNLIITNSNNYSVALSPIVLNSLTILNNTVSSKPFGYVHLWSDIVTNDLIVPEPVSERLYISLVGNLSVNNSISIQPTLDSSSIKRVILTSALEINGIFEKDIGGSILTAINTDFYGITVTASSVDCTRCGDLGFNNGIDFDESRTLYWSGTNSDVWSASKWSTVSGQSGSEQYPLAQDNVILDNTSSASILVIDKCWAVKNLDASSRSIPLTLSDNARGTFDIILDYAQIQHYEQFLRITGNLSLSSSIEFDGTTPFVFLNEGVHTINASYLPGLGIDTHRGIVRLVNNLSVGTNISFNPNDPLDDLYSYPVPRLDSVISIASGTFDINRYKLETTKINSRLSLLPCIDPYNIYASSSTLNNPQEKLLKFVESEIRLGKTSSPITGDISLIDEGPSYRFSNILRYSPHFDIECIGGLLVDVCSTTGTVSINATRYLDVSAERNPLPRIQLSGLASTYDIKCSLIEDILSTRSNAFSVRITNRDSVVYVHNWSLQGSANGSIALSNIGDGSLTNPSPLTKTGGGIVQADYLNISNSLVQPPNTWYAGANSVNAGNNINWIFANPYDPETSGDFFIMLD